MTIAEEFFNDLVKEIPNVKPVKMFGALCMKTQDGKSAAGAAKDFGLNCTGIGDACATKDLEMNGQTASPTAYTPDHCAK
jgi:hypothetical protein